MKIIVSIALFFISATLLAQKFVAEYRGVDISGSIILRGDNTFFYNDTPHGVTCSLWSNFYIGNYEMKGNRLKLTTLPENKYVFNATPFMQHDSSKLVVKLSKNMLAKFHNITISVNLEDIIYFHPDKNGRIEIKWNDYKWKYPLEKEKLVVIMVKTESCYAYLGFADMDTLPANGYVIDYNDNEWKENNDLLLDLLLFEDLPFKKDTFEFKKIEETLKLVKTTVKHRLMKKLKLVK